MATNVFSIYFQMQAIGMAMQNNGNSNSRLRNKGACLNIASKPFPKYPRPRKFGILWYSSTLFKEKIRQNNTNELKEKTALNWYSIFLKLKILVKRFVEIICTKFVHRDWKAKKIKSLLMIT